WEFATAVMGIVLGINPFDEPNVKESKDNTGEVLKYYEENGKLPEQDPEAKTEGLKIYFDEELFLKNSSGKNTLIKGNIENNLNYFFDQIKKGDYTAIMAYIQKDKLSEKYLQKIRELIRSSKAMATTVGYGPRFLHSTGQLHKGGADNGVYIQIVADDTRDIAIPGRPYTFSILKQSQAVGDYESLVKHNRRVIKIDLGKDINKGFKELYKTLKKIL
ncbi:MAG: transaldolase, partial [Ignavibacteria bacterium]|nr:transaldolase [Ignavibacteria bacterium]